MSNWMSPKLFLASKGIKITAGMVLDPEELGMPEHKTFGPLPVVKVLDAKDDGSVFLHGEIECSECGEIRVIEPGDWFQVRRCQQHQRQAQRKAKKIAKTPEQLAEEKAARETDQKAKAADRALLAAEKKLAAATKHAEEMAAKKALLEKVAAEKGAEISKDANLES